MIRQEPDRNQLWPVYGLGKAAYDDHHGRPTIVDRGLKDPLFYAYAIYQGTAAAFAAAGVIEACQYIGRLI